MPTYLPPPAAQSQVQPAERAVWNQRVGVNSELGKYELQWRTNHQPLQQGVCSVDILHHVPFLFHIVQTGWEASRTYPERALWVELMWGRASGAAAYCPHGWLGSGKPDGALSRISMSPTQIATFIHSSHTITPKRLEASPSINRGTFVFQWHCSSTKTQQIRMSPYNMIGFLFIYLFIQKCVLVFTPMDGAQGQWVRAW